MKLAAELGGHLITNSWRFRLHTVIEFQDVGGDRVLTTTSQTL